MVVEEEDVAVAEVDLTLDLGITVWRTATAITMAVEAGPKGVAVVAAIEAMVAAMAVEAAGLGHQALVAMVATPAVVAVPLTGGEANQLIGKEVMGRRMKKEASRLVSVGEE